MDRSLLALRSIVERHGGTLGMAVGDVVVAVFGIPRVHEDDAVRAVRAAAELRERLPALAAEIGVMLSLRVAIDTGEVFSDEGADGAIGDATGLAAQLENAAAPGETILGERSLRLVRDAVTVEPVVLRGAGEPASAFRLLSVDPLAPGRTRHLEATLVGRRRELGLLRGAWERSVDQSGCHLFTLLGAAGVGKSRLVGELLATVARSATVLEGRCLHYGEGITFWPLLEALMTIGERAGPVIEHLGRGGAATPEELFFEVRRLLEALASERPLILHIDDLQWAEAMLLDLLDHVVELSRGAPLLLLCSARPELLEERPTWGGGKLNATTVLLEPLATGDCELLLDQLGDGLPQAARAQVIAASDGNPLFLEEMAALARERGTVAIPPTIQALLAARLDRLDVEERELLERGAIEGGVFHRQAVDALTGDGTVGELERAISGLVRKELIRPHPPTIQGDDAFRFRHLLIRDAAYESVPKATRADLHARFADWLEDRACELPELDEIAGWHLEQAVRYRRELGRAVDAALAHRGAEHLHLAGRRAGERGDVGAATNLLERALALAPGGSTLQAAAAVDLAERLIDIGALARVDDLLVVGEADPDVGDLAALTRFEWMIHTEPQAATPVIEAKLPRILESFAEADDARGLAKTHMVASGVHWLGTHATATGEELRLVADYARKAGDAGLRSRALAQYVLTLIYGRENADALARELDVIEREDLGPYLAAFLDLGKGELQRLEGNFDEARRYTQRAINGLGSLGMGAAQGGLEQDLGQIELSAGNPAAALEALLRSDAILTDLGERALRSTTQALIAEAYECLGERAAAEAAIARSTELSASEDVLNYVITHRVRARFALSDGEHAAAESWARSAVDYACRTDFPRSTGQARLDLARVLMSAVDVQSAISEASKALELFRGKGDQPGAAQAEKLIGELNVR